MWKPKIGDRVMRLVPECEKHVGQVGEIIEERFSNLPWVVRWPDGYYIGYSADELILAQRILKPSDEAVIEKIMATTGIDRAGAERAFVDGKRLADEFVSRSSTESYIIKEKDDKIKALQQLIDLITRDGLFIKDAMTDDQIALLFEAKGWSVGW